MAKNWFNLIEKYMGKALLIIGIFCTLLMNYGSEILASKVNSASFNV